MDYSLEELLPIVAKLSEKYTAKESTSVTYETAEQLMEAVIYCINHLSLAECEGNEFLENESTKELWNPSDKISAETAYQRGYEKVLEKTKKARELYDSIILDFQAYGNRAYYDTVVEGMPQFFLWYDAKFSPGDHLLTLDYPTIKPLEEMCGVDIIYSYLSCIQLEQIFLSAFSEDYIKAILTYFHYDYEELLINIASVVLRDLLGHMIVEKKFTNEGFQKEDYLIIKEFLNGKTKEELEQELFLKLQILVGRGYGNNEKLLVYLSEDIKEFSFILMNAAENDCLHMVFSHN